MSTNSSGIQAAHMSLYPTKDSLIEAVQYIEAQAPVEPHELFPLIMMYHNTLLQELARAAEPRQALPDNVVRLTQPASVD